MRQSVTAAIKRGGYRVTVGDVAAAAGVRLSEAEEALKALAADTLAHLEVSEQGDVVYAFNQGFEARLLRRSLLLRARPVWAAIVQWVGYITRIAFGSSLVAGAI